MLQNKCRSIIGLIVLYFLAYIVATINKSVFWTDVLSPIGALVSFFALLWSYIRSNKKHTIYVTWLLFSLACLSWAIADIMWAVDDFILKVDPSESLLITSIYALPNIFFATGVLNYALHQFRKWNGIKIVNDVFASSAAGLYFIWKLFNNQILFQFNYTTHEEFIFLLSVFLDIAIIIGISIWYAHVRFRLIPIFQRLISVGILLFTLTDLIYYYLYLNDLYIPNTTIDIIYLTGFVIISIGGFCEIFYNKSMSYAEFIETEDEIKFNYRGLFILICPIVLTIIKGFYFTDLLFYVVIVTIYQGSSTYIISSLKNERLLQKERELTDKLEMLISERTQELMEKNRKLVETNEALDFRSRRETVTNLYHRGYFHAMLSQKISTLETNKTIALLYMELDHFKIINDTYGHKEGDNVLKEIANRINAFSGDTILLSRYSGAEFSMAVVDTYDYTEAIALAQRIIDSCIQEIIINDYTFHVTLTIGISIYPKDAMDIETLMKNADIALVNAKQQGQNKISTFDTNLSKKIRRRQEIELLLMGSELSEFELFYQPQFRISDKKLVGAEALIRWKDSKEGYIMPAEFIPIAEESDCILKIGSWVMQEAAKQCSEWNNKYNENLKIGINISPKQFGATQFMNEFESIITNNKIEEGWLDIEITESIEVEGNARIKDILELIKSKGGTLSIDDFGTGYSSLGYIRQFHFDRIKIAKSHIDSITADSYDLQVIKAIIILAKATGTKTIAEGVETKEQFDLLKEIGCDEIQGYFLGRPVPADQFEEAFFKTTIQTENS